MGEQDTDHRAADGTGAFSGSPVSTGEHRVRRGAAGRVVQRILNALAAIARLVGGLFAVVLLVRIGLEFVAVNPHNVIVEGVVRFSDALVLEFRDLFLPADPRIAVAVNYGLAAVFWLVAGLVVGWALSGLGQLAARASDRRR